MTKGNPVWKLLKRNVSVAQLSGFAVANLLGLAIVMTAVQFYRDVDKALSPDTSVGSDYVVLSKQVNPFRASNASFSKTETDSLAAKPWAVDVGEFTSSDFNVSASVDFGGRNMSTALFFESVPDRFLDNVPAGWSYSPGDTTVPIILPKDYLSLYNFGFASARGLPVVSEAMIGMIPLRISVSGNGRQAYFKGRVAGFTSRLNTIVVPESFMEYANGEFGENSGRRPSRLIVKMSSTGTAEAKDYIESHGLETGREADFSQMSFLLTVLTSTVGVVGIMICVLSLFILLLSLNLLLEKNSSKIRSLILLGYTPGEVGRYYVKVVVTVNLIVLAGASAVVCLVAPLWIKPLETLNVEPASMIVTLIAGAAITAAVTLVNVVSVRRQVKGCI